MASEAVPRGSTGLKTPKSSSSTLLRRVVPFVIAAVLLVVTFSRIDFDAFVAALRGLNVFTFLGFVFVWHVVLLGADALGNVAAYRLTMPNVKYTDFVLFRGASYIPGMVNYHLGQAYLTYLLARLAGLPVARMAGATLVSYAGWMGCLFGCVVFALPMTTLPIAVVPIILVTGISYLAVVQIKPKFLAKVSFFAPLFEAGLKGHLIALAARVPHLLVMVLGTWTAYEFFGVALPTGVALVYIPILLAVTTLPITPQGFGTRETVAGLFFARYAGAGTEAEQLGRIAAASTTWLVGITLAAVSLGVICSRFVAKRLALLAEPIVSSETLVETEPAVDTAAPAPAAAPAVSAEEPRST